MKTYTEKEVVKLLADFGTHVAEQCTGKKLEIAGELMKWWKLNIPAVSGRSEQLKCFISEEFAQCHNPKKNSECISCKHY